MNSIVKKKKTFKFKPVKTFKPIGSNPKDKEFRDGIEFWREIDTMIDGGNCIAVPLKANTKQTHNILGQDMKGVRYKNGAWTWDQMDLLMKGDAKNVPAIDKHSADLGILISGSLGVLDFDCESAWIWFQKKFNLDVNQYLVTTSTSKTHDCDCGREVDTKYHIYFLRSGHLLNRDMRVKCLWDENFEKRLDLDFIIEFKTGTSHVVSVPFGSQGKKQWVNQDVDDILALPEDVIAHFNTHWYVPPAKREDLCEHDKWLELLNLLPKGYHFNGSKYYQVLKTLRLIGIQFQDVFKWSRGLKQSSEAGVDHAVWLQRAWFSLDMSDTSYRDGHIIKTLLSHENKEEYDKTWLKYLGVTGEDFGINYINDFQGAKIDYDEKRRRIAHIYNKYFIVETSSEPTIYKITYTKTGKFSRLFMCKDGVAKLKTFYGKSIQLHDAEESKPVNTFEWWFQTCQSSWYKGVYFEPYGIIHNREEKSTKKGFFNTFPGYQVEYKIDYACPSDEVARKGELIYQHVFEVFCKNNQGLTNTVLAWLKNVIVLGRHSKIMLVLYSQTHGAGKSLWWEWMMKQVVGEQIFSKTADFKTMLDSRFTEALMDKTFCMIEEIPAFRYDGSRGSGAVWSKTKSYITDELQQGEKKFKASKGWTNYNNFVGLTNNPNCMHPEIPARRAIMLAISNDRAGDTKYHSALVEALESHDAWVYFIHKYLIKNTNIKSLARTMAPNCKWLDEHADTEWRQMSLKKAVTSFIQWWCYLIDGWKSISPDENTLKHMSGKHIPITNYTDPKGKEYQGLLENYQRYCEDNGEYCLVKNANQFKQRMEQDFETQAKIIQTYNEVLPIKAGTDMALFDGQTQGRKRYGEYIIFTETILNKINTVCTSLINDKAVSIKMSSKEHYENIISIEEDGWLPDEDPNWDPTA